MLAGKKTYLVAAVMAIVAFLKGIGLEVPQALQDALLWLIGAAGLASLRDAINRTGAGTGSERTERGGGNASPQ